MKPDSFYDCAFMSDRFTDNIEPFALATRGWTIEGKIPLAELQRLGTLVRSTQRQHNDAMSISGNPEGDLEGNAEFTLSFDIDEGGVPRVGGHVSTILILQCQRCMEEMEYPVALKVQLGIVPSRQAAENLPDNYDPLVVSGDEITIASILEDELILAMPIVAMHENESCPQGEAFNNIASFGQEAEVGNMAASKRENPFAVLAQLKEAQSGKLADNVNIDSTNVTSSNKDEE